MASTGSENRENPRNLATVTKVVATELPPQKPTQTILDRFKALLRQRDDELRGSAEDDTVTPPSAEEIVHFYDLLLSELTFNSKPIITDLTIIAGDQKEHGKGIAEGICARILEVFCEAYRQVHPNQHNAMQHLFGTWSAVFPPSVVRMIEAQIQFSPSANDQSSGLTPSRASESPRPTHGIHVNPKYLRQLEHSAVDGNIQQARETSALKLYGQKPSIGYDEFDLGQAELLSSQAGDPRLSSTGNAVEEFAADHSSRRLADRSSTAHLKFKYGLGRATGGDEEMSSLHGKHYAGSNHTLQTRTMYNVSNGNEHQQPRALIDAYGNDTGKRSFNDKPLLGQRHDINGIDNKVFTPSWQNTEEEEFDWEDLSRPLVDRSRSNDFLSTSVPPFGRVSVRPAFGVQRASPLMANQAQLPALDNSSMITEDAVPLLSFGRGSMGKIPGFRAERSHILDSRYPQEAWNMPPHLAKGRGRNFHLPLRASGMSSSDGEKSPVDKLPDNDSKIRGPQSIISRFGSSNLDSISVEVQPAVVPASMGARPLLNVHNSRPPSLQPIFSQKRSQFDLINASNNVNNCSPNGYLYMPDQQLDGFGNKELGAMKLSQLPNQRAGLISLNQRNQVQVTPLQLQFLPSQGAHPSSAAVVPPHLVAPRLNHGYKPQMHGAAVSTVLSKPVTGAQLVFPVQNIPNSSLHLQGGTLPLPPGVPPTSSQMIPLTQNAVPVVSNQQTSISGLIGSLMAQGLVSLTRPTPLQDSVGVEFNADLLKVRHESAISALYTDLPRQCTTCGLRFKCQEEHSSHMDWHVTKNRMSKNRKQKPSRKWFVSVSMWLSGAEALGSEAVPGFLPTEVILEKKDDEEMAVPADDDQNACALCGEPFDDFYSDETEEWMYKGAVYLNMPGGLTAGMDRSQLGPIVHAKCRSESSVVSPEDFRQDERGITAEGSQSKRMRLIS
ncbi:hypothetical protein CIPAW_10G069000 [Carya illinoinensis]|uniref:C2H2-type domain-containing protein n=1 Tax=Carya illinoinensis TaxID=32201 RepID=A0A8T1PBP9_CARIL|nr:hypothetical protein CIPAW_10G069000 [Carya illinoinensis]